MARPQSSEIGLHHLEGGGLNTQTHTQTHADTHTDTIRQCISHWPSFSKFCWWCYGSPVGSSFASEEPCESAGTFSLWSSLFSEEIFIFMASSSSSATWGMDNGSDS